MEQAYDLIVIGAGAAGQSAAYLASSIGRRVLLIERHRPGGVVATTGGAPTKTLRDAALALTGFGQQEAYGVRPAVPLDVALPIIATRIRQVCDQVQRTAAREIAERGIDYLPGVATLRPGGVVRVVLSDGTRREFRAKATLIAAGSRPARQPGIPLDDPDVYDSEEIYSITTVPADIVIAGGGPIGVEFATVFAALGIPATLISQTPGVLPAMDDEIADLMTRELAQRGVRVVPGASVDRVTRIGGQLRVSLSTGADLDTAAVLLTAGRVPSTAGLGLADAGVQLDGHGRIIVDRSFRTTAPGVFAAGDVVRPGLASHARQQGRAAASHACGLIFALPVDQAASMAVYGLPEVAAVGFTEEQANADGIPNAVGRCELGTTDRGVIAGRGGRLKLVFRADDHRLLGVHCIGDLASEIVALGHVMLHLGEPVEVFLTLGLNTPTYTEAYHAAALDGLLRLGDPVTASAGMSSPS